MSVPKKNTTWGNMLYEGKEYSILSSQLSDEIVEKVNKYYEDSDSQTYTSAPWRRKKDWCIENGQLYLIRLYTDEIHKEIFGSEKKVLADWVSEMKLLVKHRRVCKTYERRNSYLNEMDTLHLSFNQGSIIDKRSETELYTSIEMKNYIDRHSAYATLRIDSMDLLEYLENEDVKLIEDQILLVMLNFIEQMIQKSGKEDISLATEDVKAVLKEGEVAVFASAKGSDIDEMVASLTYSMTDEVLEAKGCLIHLTMNKNYPISNVENIVNGFENKLGFTKEKSSDAYFIFGTRLSDEMSDDEVLIRVLLSI